MASRVEGEEEPVRTGYWLAAVFLSSSALAANQNWNFDSNPVEKMAPGWTNASGTWQVARDPTALSKPNVLAQVSSEHSGNYFNVAVADGPSVKDVTLSVRSRGVAGREDQGGGMVWRYRDIGNYYLARQNNLENNYRVYKVVGGRRIQLGSADVTARTGTWHDLKVTMNGSHIQCFFDGKKYLDVTDTTFPGPGKVGLWTKADAQTHFDDFRVEGQ
jgi:hypothetical protein